MRPVIRTAKSGLVSCLCAVVLSNSMLAASTASAAEDAVVEALIQRGIHLRRNSADAEALAVFLEAEKQDPTSVRVLLHVATAAQAAGQWLLADSYMRKVSALSNDPYYARHKDAIEVVRRSIATRVGTFQAQGEPDGASVRLDGQLVGTLPMSEPASVEAGAYLMEVHKPGFYRLRRNVTISGGVLTREPVELNRVTVRSDLGVGAAAGGAAPGNRASSDPGAEPSWWQSPAVGWSLLGVGVASGVMSGIALQLREDRAESWNDETNCIPDNGRTRQQQCGNLKDDAEMYQTISLATGIAGVVFAGTGLALLIAGAGDDEGDVATDSASNDGLKITNCGAGFASIACSGSF